MSEARFLRSAEVKKTVKIAPSILSADLLALRDDIISVEEAGADWHHVDVMDGHFVPNLTFGLPLIKQLKKITRIPIDVHIMVSNPDEVAQSYVDAGADLLTFHIEAAKDPRQLAKEIRAAGAKVGVSLKPDTAVQSLRSCIETIDLVLVMSVNPGFGGQAFMEQTPARIREIIAMAKEAGVHEHILISVDGGINRTTAPIVRACGVDVLVAGTAVYNESDRRMAIDALRH